MPWFDVYKPYQITSPYWPQRPMDPSYTPVYNPCPGIKAIEYNPDGTIRRIEYFPPTPDPVDTATKVTC